MLNKYMEQVLWKKVETKDDGFGISSDVAPQVRENWVELKMNLKTQD
jgi:hypothetical protein